MSSNNFKSAMVQGSRAPQLASITSYTCTLDVSGSKAYTSMSHAQSKQLAAPLGVPPYLRCGKWRTGLCSEGGRCTADNGKNISSSPVLADEWGALRCGLHIRTATATVSQRWSGEVQEGGEEKKMPQCPLRRGAMTASLFAGRSDTTAGSPWSKPTMVFSPRVHVRDWVV